MTQPLTHVVRPTLHCLPSLHVLQLSSQEQRWLQFPLSGVVGLSVGDVCVGVLVVEVTSGVTGDVDKVDFDVVVVVVVVVVLIAVVVVVSLVVAVEVSLVVVVFAVVVVVVDDAVVVRVVVVVVVVLVVVVLVIVVSGQL